MQLQFFKKSHSFKRRNSEINPNLFWIFIFFTGFFLMLLVFVFGYYIFTQISKGLVLKMDDISGRVETVKRERLEKTLEYFSLRKQKSNQILNSPSPVVDPSL